MIWARLMRVTADAEDALGELVATFFREADIRLAKARAAAAVGAYDLVASLAHSLRGSSASMGATAVAERCMVLEIVARNGQRVAVERAVNELDMSLDSTAALVADRVPPAAALKLSQVWQR